MRGQLHEFLRHRQHPIKILGYTSRTLWLLVIPIAKNLVTSHFDIQGWLRTYWLDLFTILAIISLAVFRWLFVYYEIGEGSITAHTGPFGLFCTTIFFSEISAMRVEQGIVYRSVQAGALYLETQARSLSKFEIKLVISQKSIEEIFKLASSRSEGSPMFTVKPKNSLVLIYSLMFSSVLSGLVIFGTLLWQGWRIAGTKLRDVPGQVESGLHKVDESTLKLSESVPELILLLGGTFIAAWLISFVSNLLNNWNFEASRRGDTQLLIRSGKYTRNRCILNREQINYYDIRQSLLMKLSGISSVHMQCSGFGRRKRHPAALIPMTKNSEMAASMKLLEPDLGTQRTQVRPGKRSLWSFIGLPALICPLPFAAGTAAKQLIENTDNEINFFIVVLTVPLVWLTAVRGVASRCTSFGMTGDTCTLCYCPSYRYHKVIIPMGNVSSVQIRQNPIERYYGSCTVAVYSDHEIRKAHKVSHLPYRDVCEVLSRYINTAFSYESPD